MSNPFLSIIIPAYNEERRLPGTLEQIVNFLSSQDYPAEVIIVENGSSDRTLEIAQQFASVYSIIRVFHSNERGKGMAVRQGMLEAQGEYRFMCDADLSMPISEIKHFLPPALNGFDIAIGSREAPGAVRYHEPAYRHIGGRLINLAIRLLALPGLNDSQCGFKCFRGTAAEDVFRKQTMSGWSFDIEILFIARLHCYHIVEVPIPWYFNPESKLSAIQDAVRMLRDILMIRVNALKGAYGGKV